MKKPGVFAGLFYGAAAFCGGARLLPESPGGLPVCAPGPAALWATLSFESFTGPASQRFSAKPYRIASHIPVLLAIYTPSMEIRIRCGALISPNRQTTGQYLEGSQFRLFSQ